MALRAFVTHEVFMAQVRNAKWVRLTDFETDR